MPTSSLLRSIYRADHVGSLLRPAELLEARRGPRLQSAQLEEIENRHILRVLERQRDLGFRIFTDGELRRTGFMGAFYDSVEGLDRDGSIARRWANSDSSTTSPKGLVVERIRQTKRLAANEVQFLIRHSPGDVKITVPSPNQFPAIMYRRGVSDRAYASHSDFLWDIVPILAAEVTALSREGIRYIQIDAPRYSYYIDPKWRQYVQDEMHMGPMAALDEAIRADNACFGEVHPDDAIRAIHLCRGNYRSQWYAEGGYDPIAEKLFAELDVDLFLLEYDSERAGTFEPLRFVPTNKGVVLGLISSKGPALESKLELQRRLDEAARYIPLERLALSPQCGFASTMEGNLLSEDDQWRKLALVVEAARAVWGEV